MAAKAELKAVLSLDNLQFVRNIKASIKYAKDLAATFRRQPIQTTFAAGLIVARRSVQGVAGAVERIGTTSVKAFKLGLAGATALGVGMIFITKQSIEAASELENYTRAFSVLLGSMDAGKQRMRDLLGFANDKGLRLTVVADASQTLQTLTQGALAGAKGLQFVGDVAAGTRRPLGEMAVTLGRLYDALRTGRSAGQELSTLQEIGAISGQARRQIEALSNAHFGAEAWQVAQKELAKYNGMLTVMSTTWSARMERFKDSIEEAMRQFGTPAMEALKPTLSLLSTQIFGIADRVNDMGKKFGQSLALGVDVGLAALRSPFTLVAPLEHALKYAFLSSTNLFLSGLRAGFSLVVSTDFLGRIAQGFQGLSQVISGYLIAGFQKPIAYLIAGIEKAKDMFNPSKKANLSDIIQLQTLKGQASTYAENLDRPGNKEKYEAKVQEIVAFAAKVNKKEENKSMSQRVSDLMKSGDLDVLSKETIQAGKAKIRTSTNRIMTDLDKMVRDFHYVDYTGANVELKKAANALKVSGQLGQQFANNMSKAVKGENQRRKEEAIRSNYNESSTSSEWRLRRVFNDSLSTGGLRSTGGLSTGSLSDPARRTTSLLSFEERRRFDMERRAGVMGTLGHRAPGDTLIRSGDRQRMQDFQRERLREKFGIEKTNAILEAIQHRFDELVNN